MPKEGRYETSGRRSVLKRLSVGAVGGSLLAGSVAADPDENKGKGKENRGKGKRRRTAAAPASASMKVDPSTPGLNDRERADFIEQMVNKYGPGIANSIRPNGGESTGDIVAQGQQPGIEPGTIVWDNTAHLKVKNLYGTTLVESDNYAALYETDVYTDGGTKRYYFYWLWSSAQSQDSWYVTGDIKQFWNHINLTNNADLTVYDPGGDVKKNGIPITVSATVSGKNSTGTVGASAGIQGTFYLAEDKVGPHPDRTGQDTDEFAVRWKGNYEGAQEINGTLVERRSIYDYRSFEWNVYLNGDGI